MTAILRGATLCLVLIGICRSGSAVQPPSDSDQQLYDMLMILDMLAASDPPLSDAGDAETADEVVIDESWMLAILERLAEDTAVEQEEVAGQLRSALFQLRRLEAAAEAEDARTALGAAATRMARMLNAVEELEAIPSDAMRYAIADAQYAIALFHCNRADQEPRGTLARPEPPMHERLDHLARAASAMRQASLTARYRLPEPVKRSLAASVAMSRLFDPDDIQLRQVRQRAREIEKALDDLARAIRRATP